MNGDLSAARHETNTTDQELFFEIKRKVYASLKISKTRTDFLLTVKFIIYFFLAIVSYIAIYKTNSLPILIFDYLVFGFCGILLGLNFAHEFAHNTIFRSHKLNNFFFEAIFVMLGVNGPFWKQRHIYAHHHAPNVKHYDADLEMGSLIFLSPGHSIKKYHQFQHLYAPVLYLFYTLVWIFYKDFSTLSQKKSAHISFSPTYIDYLKFWVFKIFYIIYLLKFPLLFSEFNFYEIMIAFLIMHLVNSWFLLFTFLITHHVENTYYPVLNDKNYIEASWLMNQVKSSNDFHPFSKTANFIFGGFNCHIAHHLFPHINHIYSPQITRVVYQVLEENKLRANYSTFTGGIFSHLRLLKKIAETKASFYENML